MPDIEGIPVESIEVTGHTCWWCGQTIPRDDDADIRYLAIAYAPWELDQAMVAANGSYVYVHSAEFDEASREMHKEFNQLLRPRKEQSHA